MLLFTLGVTALCTSARADDVQGHYAVFVRGYWTGTGDATVSGGTVTVTAVVQTPTGQSGSLVISNLPLSSNNHFTGSGTVLGVAVSVDGRVQPPDPNGKQSVTTNAILAATVLGGGHGGRVAGGRDAAAPPGP